MICCFAESYQVLQNDCDASTDAVKKALNFSMESFIVWVRFFTESQQVFQSDSDAVMEALTFPMDSFSSLRFSFSISRSSSLFFKTSISFFKRSISSCLFSSFCASKRPLLYNWLKYLRNFLF